MSVKAPSVLEGDSRPARRHRGMPGRPVAIGRAAAVLLALAAGSLGGGRPEAEGAVLTVQRCDGHPDGADAPAGGLPGQLRRLINDASPGDLVVIPPGCTVTLAGAADDELNQSGDLDILKDLTIQGAGPGRSVIDGGAVDRVIHVHFGQSLSLSGVTIRNGRTAGGIGGGILAADSLIRLKLTHVHVTGNVVEDGSAPLGGGIFLSGQPSQHSLTHVTVSGNQAFDRGGGLYIDSGTVSLQNVTISGNRAGASGGVLIEGDAVASLDYVTITDNSASGSGGGLRVDGADTGVVRLRASIIAGNRVDPGGSGADCSIGTPVFVSLGFNLVQDPADCPGLVATDLTGQDPRLGPLAANGGPTPTHALQPGSPALDAGDGACPAVDQRGVLRAQGPRCDIGAVEEGGRRGAAPADFDGDGHADLVAITRAAPANLFVFSGATGTQLAVAPTFLGGPHAVAVCDLTGDGVPEVLIAGRGQAGPEIEVLQVIPSLSPPAFGLEPLPALSPLSPFGEGLTAGGRVLSLRGAGAPSVACADVSGDGVPDIIAGAPPGSLEGPVVRVFSGTDGALIIETPALDGPSGQAIAVGP